MRADSNRLPAIMAAISAALLLAACGSTASPGGAGAAGQSGHNRADVVFVAYMVPHHQQGVDLAAIVPAHSTNPDLVKLAAGIVSAQESEIDKMANMLTQWSAQPDSPDSGPAGPVVTGKVDPSTFGKLGALNGGAFDTLWLHSMIDHHRGALEMANTEMAKGTNPDAKAMAKQMVDAQQGQIGQMTKMLGG